MSGLGIEFRRPNWLKPLVYPDPPKIILEPAPSKILNCEEENSLGSGLGFRVSGKGVNKGHNLAAIFQKVKEVSLPIG